MCCGYPAVFAVWVLGCGCGNALFGRFGRMLGAGIVIAIVFQAAINIGVVTVVLPTKGIPLPFISAGGTSMLLTSAAVEYC
jgi:cell division protein FtsW